ncbi:MAG: hypothetical protein K5745_05380, partial [Saccharofermentans sp.]|nr:hypothetical protein [Saccharofermentans sp.]
MANSGKTKKSSASSAKTAVMISVIVIVMIIVGWFVYISGILPKTITGMEVYESGADGTAHTTVEKYSILEVNFYFNEIFSNYAQSGYISAENLDEVYDESTGETYRDMLMSIAGSELQNIALVNREAQASDFMQYSQADRYAQSQLDNMAMMAQFSGYQTVDQFLGARYGTGMTSRQYKDIVSSEILTNEYEEYLKQFKFAPTAEQIQAEYDADPSAYQLVTFNYYFVAAETDDAGNITDLDSATATAEKLAGKVTDSASFREAVMDYLEDEGNDTALESFADDQDPTLCENYSSMTMAYMPEGFSEFLFAEDTEAGATKVITTDTGAYVILFVERGLDEETVVSYRTIEFANDTELDITTATAEQLQADAEAQAAEIISGPVDSLGFYSLAKQYSTDTSAIVSGGLVTGAVASDFESTEENPLASEVVAAGQWLFDPARAAGDYTVILSEDKSMIYIYYFEASMAGWQDSARTNIVTAATNDWGTTLNANNPQYVLNTGLIE